MHLEMWSLKLLTSYYSFYRIRFRACSRMLRERLSNFFWMEGRKEWSLAAENTQFVHACVLAEIDVMALIGGIW